MRALWITVLLVGCMDGLPTEDPQTADRRGPCVALENLTFRATQPGECGLGPDGPIACSWELTFLPGDTTRTAYQWAHSDVGEAGYVTCNGGSIISDEPGLYEGSFDDGKLDLLWDDRPYALVP